MCQTHQCGQESLMNKINDYGNIDEPQEAEGSLKIHKPTILGKVGKIRPHCWASVNNDNYIPIVKLYQ